jgi:hypothetical protein
MNQVVDVKEILRSSGWLEGRKIDTAAIEKHCNNYGFELFPNVLRFLEEFGMLDIVIERYDKSGEKVERHSTDPLTVVGEYFRHGKFKTEEDYAGEKLVIVGEACNGNHLLFVSESGKVYCSTGKLGDNAWEAWEALINNKGFKSWGTLQRERT